MRPRKPFSTFWRKKNTNTKANLGERKFPEKEKFFIQESSFSILPRFFLFLRQCLAMLPKLAFNFWAQELLLPPPFECVGLQELANIPGPRFFSKQRKLMKDESFYDMK
jgi:hypothetical protein